MLLQIAQSIVDDELTRQGVVLSLVWLFVAIYKRIFKLKEGECVQEKIATAVIAATVLGLAAEYVQYKSAAGEVFNVMDVVSQILLVVLGSTGLSRFGKRAANVLKKKD